MIVPFHSKMETLVADFVHWLKVAKLQKVHLRSIYPDYLFVWGL